MATWKCPECGAECESDYEVAGNCGECLMGRVKVVPLVRQPAAAEAPPDPEVPEPPDDPFREIILRMRAEGKDERRALMRCQIVLQGSMNPDVIERCVGWEKRHGPPTWDGLLAWAAEARAEAREAFRTMQAAGGLRTKLTDAEKATHMRQALEIIAAGELRGGPARERLADAVGVARKALQIVDNS